MLWLALHLTRWSLEVHTRGGASSVPQAVVQAAGQRQVVVYADTEATRRGVLQGMTVSAAYALAPTLCVIPRDVQVEQVALEHLAAWAGQFTSLVSLVPPQDLVLEIGGSLMLFRGVRHLRQHVRAGLKQLGYSAQLAVAPTPLAATWLARAPREMEVMEIACLERRLASLPVQYAGFATKQMHLLQALGVRNVGDVLNLPRDGLARRLGPEFIGILDRALGKLPDPRTPYVSPPYYEGYIAFPNAVEHTEALLFALKRLMQELAGLLSARMMGVQRLTVLLRHAKAPVTPIELGLVAPSRDDKHWLHLFQECLQRVALPEAVEALTLRALDWVRLEPRVPDLFIAKSGADISEEEWIERLQARLGRAAVQGLASVAEHRPEYAWRYRDPTESLRVIYVKQRPLWLLPEPRLLEEREGQPYCNGMLRLEAERERIESGWWDERAVVRDYFIACTAEGARLWVFRELTGTRRWMLHGVFA